MVSGGKQIGGSSAGRWAAVGIMYSRWAAAETQACRLRANGVKGWVAAVAQGRWALSETGRVTGQPQTTGRQSRGCEANTAGRAGVAGSLWYMGSEGQPTVEQHGLA